MERASGGSAHMPAATFSTRTLMHVTIVRADHVSDSLKTSLPFSLVTMMLAGMMTLGIVILEREKKKTYERGNGRGGHCEMRPWRRCHLKNGDGMNVRAREGDTPLFLLHAVHEAERVCHLQRQLDKKSQREATASAEDVHVVAVDAPVVVVGNAHFPFPKVVQVSQRCLVQHSKAAVALGSKGR